MKRVVWITAGIVWLAGMTAGATLVWEYKTTPGAFLPAPESWPSASAISFADGRAVLVMSAHPHCPCTRASIAELAKLMADVGDRLAAHVLFVKPAGTPDGWEKSDTWRSAGRVPGVRVHRDDGGREAARFGAATSGHAVLYGADGRLLFRGGITPSRGHEGDNAGRRRIASLLANGSADGRQTRVFGCPLRGAVEGEP